MPERKELQLQGPRPSALKITKDSHKIKKPPLPPSHPLPPQPQRPVIIYTVSPKIIHTDPTEFKDLVQRLTGWGHQPPSSSSSNHVLHHPRPDMSIPITNCLDNDQVGVDRITGGHGILSPTPGLLPPISPNIFNPPPPSSAGDLTSLTQFFHDLSPIAANHFSSSLDFFQQNFPDFH